MAITNVMSEVEAPALPVRSIRYPYSLVVSDRTKLLSPATEVEDFVPATNLSLVAASIHGFYAFDSVTDGPNAAVSAITAGGALNDQNS